jgi:hypothetical protein
MLPAEANDFARVEVKIQRSVLAFLSLSGFSFAPLLSFHSAMQRDSFGLPN